MKGKILDFSTESNSGAISGEDGERYTFDGSDWKGDSPPTRGVSVDFSIEGNQAKEIYQAVVTTTPAGKSRIATALLALFLGYLGIHKFYLGQTVLGIVFLLINTVGLWVTWMVLWTPNFIVGIIVFIEFIIYLTKSDEDFHQTYVIDKKQIF